VSGGGNEFRRDDAKALAYILARIIEEDRGYSTSCWVWQGYKEERGYGRTKVPGYSLGNAHVHRASYELHIGAIPDGLTIDHLCRVRACCNPAHLEAVTAYENYRRGLAFERVKQTHCKRGHELAGENVRVDRKGDRVCRTCHRLRVREWANNHRDIVRERQRLSRSVNGEAYNAKRREERAQARTA
jgi:hypothetical protein